MLTNKLIEKLAAIEHERWSRWHLYAASNWNSNNVSRWNFLSATPYEMLSEELKQKDRDEVMKYWPLIEQFATEIAAEAREEALFDAFAVVNVEDDFGNPSADFKRGYLTATVIYRDSINGLKQSHSRPAEVGDE